MTATADEKPVPKECGFKCRKCGGDEIMFYTWESSDGGHEDTHYRCLGCGTNWWVDGIDS